MRDGESIPRHFNWESVYNIVKPSVEEANNEWDNDPLTLEKEKSRFQSMLATIGAQVRVDHIEHDSTGRDLFVLSAESIDYMGPIRSLFKDLGVQYNVDVAIHQIPIKGRDSSATNMRPSQNTAVITRLPLRKLKRSFFLTILLCLLSIGAIAFFSTTFYRVVFL